MVLVHKLSRENIICTAPPRNGQEAQLQITCDCTASWSGPKSFVLAEWEAHITIVLGPMPPPAMCWSDVSRIVFSPGNTATADYRWRR